eukprot:m.41389 g.41389  ORF g.41389 m.41389 type:complete len:400 (+) comp9761_c0_seq2:258-1457(+)
MLRRRWEGVLGTALLFILLIVLLRQQDDHHPVQLREKRDETHNLASETEKGAMVPVNLETTQYRRVVRCKEPVKHRRPVLILIAGTEGCGHHGIYFALHDTQIDYIPDEVDQILTVLWDPTISAGERMRLRMEAKRKLTTKYELCVQKAVEKKVPAVDLCGYFLVGSASNMFSFPYGGPRNVLRRPDVQEMIELLEDSSTGVSFDVRIIALYRHPLSAALSNRRRKFVSDEDCLKQARRNKFIPENFKSMKCSGLFYLMREVEDNLITINSELHILSAQYFRVMYQKDFLLKPVEATVEAVSKFLGFNEHKRGLFAKAVPGMLNKRPQHKTGKFYDDTDSELLHMETIMDSIRRERWAHMINGEFDLYGVHLEPSTTGETEFGYQCANLSAYTPGSMNM